MVRCYFPNDSVQLNTALPGFVHLYPSLPLASSASMFLFDIISPFSRHYCPADFHPILHSQGELFHCFFRKMAISSARCLREIQRGELGTFRSPRQFCYVAVDGMDSSGRVDSVDSVLAHFHETASDEEPVLKLSCEQENTIKGNKSSLP